MITTTEMPTVSAIPAPNGVPPRRPRRRRLSPRWRTALLIAVLPPLLGLLAAVATAAIWKRVQESRAVRPAATSEMAIYCVDTDNRYVRPKLAGGWR